MIGGNSYDDNNNNSCEEPCLPGHWNCLEWGDNRLLYITDKQGYVCKRV